MRCLAVTYFHMGKPHTIIGAEQFHCRVRDGIGWFPLAMAARRKLETGVGTHGAMTRCKGGAGLAHAQSARVLYGQASRAISTGQLHALPRVHTPPINVVVFNGPSGTLKVQGDLILGRASRLDAFSGYPFRT